MHQIIRLHTEQQKQLIKSKRLQLQDSQMVKMFSYPNDTKKFLRCQVVQRRIELQ